MYFLKCFCCGPDHAPEEPDEPLKEQTSPRTFIRSKQAKYASTCAVHDDLQCAVALLPTASHELETLRNGGENEDLRKTFPCVSSVIPAVVDISNDVSAISSPEFQGLALGNYQVHHGVDNGIGVSSSACECASRRSVMSAPGFCNCATTDASYDGKIIQNFSRLPTGNRSSTTHRKSDATSFVPRFAASLSKSADFLSVDERNSPESVCAVSYAKSLPSSPLKSRKYEGGISLSPEILHDPLALAKLGYWYPPGYAPPYPPFPMDFTVCRRDRLDSGLPPSLEVHEIGDSDPVSSGSSTSDCSRVPSHCCLSLMFSETSLPIVNGEEDALSECLESCEHDPLSWWRSEDYPVYAPRAALLLEAQQNIGRSWDASFVRGEAATLCWICKMLGLPYDLETFHTSARDCHRSQPDVANLILTTISEGMNSHEFISAAERATAGLVYGRFFRTLPPSAFSLDRMLAFWMRNGSVPVVCMKRDSSWEYRLVIEVNFDRITLFPLADYSVQVLRDRMTSPSFQTVTMERLFYTYDIASGINVPRKIGNLHSLCRIAPELNLFGQVAYALEIEMTKYDHGARESTLLNLPRRMRPLPSLLPVLSLPTKMEGGIVFFAKRSDTILCKMLKNLRSPLSDPDL